MSLVNDMLIDLQRRNEPGGKVLAGLRPAALPSQHLPMAALAAVLVVLSVGPWGSMGGGGPVAYQPPLLSKRLPIEPIRGAVTAPASEPSALAQPGIETLDVSLAEVELELPEPVLPKPDEAGLEPPAEPSALEPSALASTPARPEPVEPDEVEEWAPGPDTLTAAVTTAAPTASGGLIKRPTTNVATQAEAALHDGLGYLRVASFFQAERQFREALALEPDHSEAWAYLYTALLQQDRGAVAEGTALDGLEQARDPAPLAKLYASALAERGELGPALDVLQAHRSGAGADIEYEVLLASLMRTAGRHTDAAEIYQGLVAGDASQGEWWMGLAISQDAVGNSLDARVAFERARSAPGVSETLADYATQRIEALRLQN